MPPAFCRAVGRVLSLRLELSGIYVCVVCVDWFLRGRGVDQCNLKTNLPKQQNKPSNLSPPFTNQTLSPPLTNQTNWTVQFAVGRKNSRGLFTGTVSVLSTTVTGRWCLLACIVFPCICMYVSSCCLVLVTPLDICIYFFQMVSVSSRHSVVSDCFPSYLRLSAWIPQIVLISFLGHCPSYRTHKNTLVNRLWSMYVTKTCEKLSVPWESSVAVSSTKMVFVQSHFVFDATVKMSGSLILDTHALTAPAFEIRRALWSLCFVFNIQLLM